MTLRVLGRISSINVRKVLWTCAELDLHFEHVENDAKLLALNPNRLVPVIRDGDFVLWESNSICRYLARKSPHAALYPEDAQARARVEQWMDWQATELNSAWRYSFYGVVRKSPAHQDAAQIARSLEAFDAHEVYPESKLSDDVCWNLGELLSRGLRQLDLHWSSVPRKRVQSSLPGPVAWRLLGAPPNAPRLVRHTK